jgi:hypothetical protein
VSDIFTSYYLATFRPYISFANEIIDPSNNFNGIIYVVPYTGTYTFSATVILNGAYEGYALVVVYLAAKRVVVHLRLYLALIQLEAALAYYQISIGQLPPNIGAHVLHLNGNQRASSCIDKLIKEVLIHSSGKLQVVVERYNSGIDA